MKSLFSTNSIENILMLGLPQPQKTGDQNNPKPLYKWQLTTFQIPVWKTLQMHQRTLKCFEARKYAEGKKIKTLNRVCKAQLGVAMAVFEADLHNS